MGTAFNNEKISTSKSIENLGLPERQRNRALAELAVAGAVVGAIIAARKLFHLR